MNTYNQHNNDSGKKRAYIKLENDYKNETNNKKNIKKGHCTKIENDEPNNKKHKQIVKNKQSTKIGNENENERTSKKNVFNESLIIMNPIMFTSPFNHYMGYSVVQRIQMMNLTNQGNMVVDNIINSYMILLVESNKMYVRIVNSLFLIELRNNGWNKARRYLQESKYAKRK